MTDDSVTRALAVADAGYAEVRAALLRAQLEALADEWDERAAEVNGNYGVAFADGKQHAAAELRAVLFAAAYLGTPDPTLRRQSPG